MQSILLVNLMRMGDILQSTPLIQALREGFPQARISMILNEAFEGAARRIDLDRRFAFPVGSFRSLLGREKRLPEAQALLKDFVREVNLHGTYDLVFNLTPSRSAASLASMIAQRDHRGMWVEQDGSFQAADPWAAYLVAMTAFRRTNPFHLIDMWLRSLGQRGPRSLRLAVTGEDAERADGMLRASGVRPELDLLVGFQVSASQQEKRWDEREFVRLGRALAQTLRARVVLFGLPEEEALCGRVSHAIPGSVNLAGKTGLGELAAALKRCRLLVTNDTGTQHVAAAVGTRVIVVSVGPVFFRETGPYGAGHLVFQARVPCAPCSFHVSCLNPVCKQRIRSEHVLRAAVRILRGGEGGDPDLPADVSCYRSGFDGDGWLEFASPRPTTEDRRLQACRAFWNALLDGGPPAPPQEAGNRNGLQQGGRLADFAALLRRSSKLMAQLGAQGRERGGAPSRLRILHENLRAVEQELRRAALEREDLAPLVNFLFIRREALSFQEPLRFLKDAASLYAAAAEQVLSGFEDPAERKEAICHGMQG
jgi:ADP-heptose:LPS heptosyltransferase